MFIFTHDGSKDGLVDGETEGESLGEALGSVEGDELGADLQGKVRTKIVQFNERNSSKEQREQKSELKTCERAQFISVQRQ